MGNIIYRRRIAFFSINLGLVSPLVTWHYLGEELNPKNRFQISFYSVLPFRKVILRRPFDQFQ